MRIDLAQLEFINPLLREMALRMEAIIGMELTVTSIHRIDDTGVHGQLPVRGLDFRCRDAMIGGIVVDTMNDIWWYDPERPTLKVCMYHGEGMNAHIHLQVHPNTIEQEERSG